MKRAGNERCHCGSGLKYKRCHGAAEVSQQGRSVLAMVVVGAVIATGLGVLGYGLFEKAGNSDLVWSQEHGHWHTADGREIGAESVPNTSGAPIPQPPGEPPAGKVWSPEHGHWHDQ